MIEAVAAAAELPPAEVRRAAMVGGGIAAVASCAMQAGAARPCALRLALFQPLAPMLAQPADDIDDAHAPRATGGARMEARRRARPGAQARRRRAHLHAHRQRRHGAPRRRSSRPCAALPADPLILDGEAIALRAEGAPYPFQDTMRRSAASLDIDAMREACRCRCSSSIACGTTTGPLRAAAARFDALRPLLPADADDAAPGHERRRRSAGVLRRRDRARSRRRDGEGARRAYDPGARSAAWLKVKRSHTLDLVVLAAEWGHGRRRGWLSNLHLGARDPASGGS